MCDRAQRRACQAHTAVGRDQDIGGFQIAVDAARLVHVCQPACYFPHHRCHCVPVLHALR